MMDLKNINDAIMFLNENDLLLVMLYSNMNNMIIGTLTETIKFIKDSERFYQPPF